MKRKQLVEFYDKWYLPEVVSSRRKKMIDDYISEQDNSVFNDAHEKFDLINNLVNISYLMASFKPVTDEEVMNTIKAMFILASEPDENDINKFVELIAPGFIYLYEFADSDFYKQLLIDNEIVGDEKIQIGPITTPISKKAIKLHLNRLNQRVLSEEDIVSVKDDFIEHNLKHYNKHNKMDQDVLNRKTFSIKEDNLEREKLNEKIDILREKLSQYGFFEIQSVSQYNEYQQTKLLQLLVENDLPYQIALLQNINFISHLNKNFAKNNTDLFKQLSNILQRPDRAIAGNIRSFNSHSGDRKKYTAYQKLEDVNRDLCGLK